MIELAFMFVLLSLRHHLKVFLYYWFANSIGITMSGLLSRRLFLFLTAKAQDDYENAIILC